MTPTVLALSVFLPLAGFLVNGLAGRRIRSELFAGIVGSATVGIVFAAALATFIGMTAVPADERTFHVSLFPWISAGGLATAFAYQIDPLSIVMTLIVSGVGFLIHVYSIGYMHGDPGFARFFAYLNLFIFAMLNLVLADNFLLLFLGWEGVGLCSYLLIGFWYDRKFDRSTTADAAKKAFVVNRIGDFGFLIAMFLVVVTFGSLDFRTVMPQAAAMLPGSPVLLWICLALFLGATGKSAQIPLFVWLPDAMAGPTPVSALIHAATMVTAGVYLVARCAVLFALAPVALQVVAIVGVVTAVFAATIGLVQNDIKKVLAYSTISQLGYMFLALGVGAFAAGIFHVLTHAFFKALLFLGAGAVIHALHDEQDIRRMGGIRRHLPTTYWTFVAAAIAIAGIPPLSGFFSKDEILWKAFADGHPALWVLGFLGAGLTAFYMFRLVALTFHGEARWKGHPHEAPATMRVPLILLAVLSVFGGLAGIPPSLGGGNLIEHWLEPVFAPAHRLMNLSPHEVVATEYILMALSVALAGAGIALAWSWYTKRAHVPARLRDRVPALYTTLMNKYFVDEAYDATVVRPVVRGSEKLLWKWVDTGLIDAAVNGTAWLFGLASRSLRTMQTGMTDRYVFVFVLGVVAILGWLLSG